MNKKCSKHLKTAMLFFLFENRMKFSLLCTSILAGGKKEIIIFLTPQRKMLAGQNAILPVVLCKKKEIQCPGRTHKSCSKPAVVCEVKCLKILHQKTVVWVQNLYAVNQHFWVGLTLFCQFTECRFSFIPNAGLWKYVGIGNSWNNPKPLLKYVITDVYYPIKWG